MLSNFSKRHSFGSDTNESIALQRDILSLQSLQSLLGGFVPLTTSAMRPAALQLIANEVVINSRYSVAECGCGVSTIVLASVLSQVGGTLVAIEQDDIWMAKVHQWIMERNLDEIVTFVHAPLNDVQICGKTKVWYDTAVLNSKLSDRKFDFLIVDGPPAYRPGEEYRRSPALDYFREWLQDKFAVVLDDISRDAEREIAHRWGTEYGIKFDVRPHAGNVAIGRRGNAFHC